MGETKVHVGDSTGNLIKSMDQLRIQQLGGPAPRLYPSASTPTTPTPAPAPSIQSSSSGPSQPKP